MAGPTPVSALIHAATMVTAGVYLMAATPQWAVPEPRPMHPDHRRHGWAPLTALAGATMGVTQYNLKKVLAYSTMSQIGLMVMACGMGAFSVGHVPPLMTHAFFKACLFLGAGAVLHALAGEEDMRRMGGSTRAGCLLPLPCSCWRRLHCAACRRSPASSPRTRSCGWPTPRPAARGRCGRWAVRLRR